MPETEKTYTEKPTDQLDAERRLQTEGKQANDPSVLIGRSDGLDEPRSFATESTESALFFGVDPQYMTHANDTEKPYAADGGVEAVAEELARPEVAVLKVEEKAPETVTYVGVGSADPMLSTVVSGEAYTSTEVTEQPTKVEGTPATEETKAAEVFPTPTPSGATPPAPPAPKE